MKNLHTALATFACPPSPVATPAPAAPHNAQDKLETLRKRLPETINRGFRKSTRGCGVEEKNKKVPLFRRLSATEAKVTVMLGGDGDFPSSILTFYLSYYEGVWTTIRHEERGVGIMNGHEKCVIDLALAIDEIGNTK